MIKKSFNNLSFPTTRLRRNRMKSFSRKLIAEIGFDGVYISGGVMSNDLGLPDIGLTTLDQVSYRAGQISRVTDLPSLSNAPVSSLILKTVSAYAL